MTRQNYTAYGLWKITTEGDCEGKTVTSLGTHSGFLDELAFRFGRSAYYSLTFELVTPVLVPRAPEDIPVDAVSVTLGIDSGTWDMTRGGRAEHVRKMLSERPVSVEEGTYYASVVLRKPKS